MSLFPFLPFPSKSPKQHVSSSKPPHLRLSSTTPQRHSNTFAIATSPLSADTVGTTMKTAANLTQAQAQAQKPNLLGMIPELRDFIYDYVLNSDVPMRLAQFLRAHEPDLLRVWKQIRSEALELYRHNINASLGWPGMNVSLGFGPSCKFITIEGSGLEPSIDFEGRNPRDVHDDTIRDEDDLSEALRHPQPPQTFALYARSVLQYLRSKSVRYAAIELPGALQVKIGTKIQEVLRVELEFLKAQPTEDLCEIYLSLQTHRLLAYGVRAA